MQNPREAQAAREAQIRAQVENAMEAARAAAQAAQGVRSTTRSELTQGDQWQALRQEIRHELAELESRRDQISEQLQNPMVGGANRRGLEQRIEQIDARIASLEAQGAQIDAAVARASGAATSLLPARQAPPVRSQQGGDDPFMVIGGLFMLCVALPLSIAYARRIWKRTGDAVAAFPADIAARLGRIEQNVDTVALEVERIGESQRFITRAFSEERGLKPGAAEPVAAEREKDLQRRGT
jgi:hypothetical protein